MRAVVNYSTEGFFNGQDRLIHSLKGYVDVYLFNPDNLECPSHQDNPYSFKIYAIEQMIKEGYTQILWLDASVYAIKDPTPVFDWLKEKGIFLEESGHLTGDWSPDYVLKYFGITKDEAMKMPTFSAGFTGLDFTNPISIEFFAKWKQSMLDGMFKGDWETHRHDLTCGSIIANQMGLVPLYSPVCQFFYPIGCGYEGDLSKVVFHLQGL